MTRQSLALIAVGLMVGLSACSSSPAAPTHDEIRATFDEALAEVLPGPVGEDDPFWSDMVDGLTEVAEMGGCATLAAWAELEASPSMLYAWSVGCLTHFEDDIAPGMDRLARDQVASRSDGD